MEEAMEIGAKVRGLKAITKSISLNSATAFCCLISILNIIIIMAI